MHILFVDESGTPPPPGKHDEKEYFVLGGIVVPEDIWAKLAQDLRLLARKYKIKGEIKWRYFAPAKPGAKEHSLSHLSAVEKESLRTVLYEKICHYKSVRLICVATQVGRAYTLSYIKTADDLYWYSYKQLTERFQYYLQDLERTVGQRVNGIIVCDHRGPKDDARLRELHFQLLNSSKATVTRYSNLIEGLFIAPLSSQCRHPVRRHGGGRGVPLRQGGRRAIHETDTPRLPAGAGRQHRRLWAGKVSERGKVKRRRRVGPEGPILLVSAQSRRK